MSNSKGISGKVVKQILKQETFLINEMPIAVFEHDDYGSIIRVINVKENKPDHVFLELPAPEEEILRFLKVHYRNQLNDASNKKKKDPLKVKVKPQERRAKDAERLKGERHKNKHHSKKVRKKN
tara:strand:+ start:146 stop:517 length:372 start_codon:yes stop_codon:yes gene_type:complete